MNFDFNGPESLVNTMPWLYCISSVLLRTQYKWGDGYYNQINITIGFTVAFSENLYNSLMNAAQRARESITENNIAEKQEALQDIASILEGIASKMPMPAANLEREEDYWEALRQEFDQKINTLKESLKTIPSASVET
ncbi:hypothetical protein C8R44DRAFT_822245 [Mycena epipterygia]|nr:hypothetical protein C8R44DRAFT_822245 [Mycena epipterygia]